MESCIYLLTRASWRSRHSILSSLLFFNPISADLSQTLFSLTIGFIVSAVALKQEHENSQEVRDEITSLLQGKERFEADLLKRLESLESKHDQLYRKMYGQPDEKS